MVDLRRRPAGPERRDDFVVFGKPVRCVLRKDRAAVDRDIEHTAAALNELRLGADLTRYRGSQTGCLTEVVSTHAVSNLDLHSILTSLTPIGAAGLTLLESQPSPKSPPGAPEPAACGRAAAAF